MLTFSTWSVFSPASFFSSRLFTTFSSCLVSLYESFAPFSRSLLVVIVINQFHCLLFSTEISLLGAAFDNMRLIVFSFLPLSCVAFTTTGIPSAVPRQVQMSPSALDAFRTSKNVEITPVESNPSSSFDSVADSLTDVCILGLRLGTCALMFHHGIDKIDHVDGFSANVVAKFFGFLPGEPAFWTYSAAATQIVGAGLLAVGIISRPVALSMMATMVTAVVFHLLNTGPEGFPLGVPEAHSYNFELAAMYVAVLAYFSAAGAGAYSIDEKVFGGELELYESLWDKVSLGKKD